MLWISMKLRRILIIFQSTIISLAITERNAIKCFEKLVAKLEPGEKIRLPFIDTPGSCYYATQHRIIKCSKNLFGFKFKEWKWDQIKSINYLKRGFTGTLILNTVHGEVKNSSLFLQSKVCV